MSRVVLLLLLASLEARASCPGLTGEAAERCNCDESSVALPSEAFQCEKDSDCTVVEGRCADWAIVSKQYAAKHTASFKNRLKKLKLPARPRAKCQEKTCLSAN